MLFQTNSDPHLATAACHVAAFLLFFGVVVALFSHSHSDIRTVFKNKRYTEMGCAVSFLC